MLGDSKNLAVIMILVIKLYNPYNSSYKHLYMPRQWKKLFEKQQI